MHIGLRVERENIQSSTCRKKLGHEVQRVRRRQSNQIFYARPKACQHPMQRSKHLLYSSSNQSAEGCTNGMQPSRCQHSAHSLTWLLSATTPPISLSCSAFYPFSISITCISYLPILFQRFFRAVRPVHICCFYLQSKKPFYFYFLQD